MSARLFPLFADLQNRAVLVVGGGVVATRKVTALLGTGARIVVGAPNLHPELIQRVVAGEISHEQGEFVDSWLDGVWLVIAATDDAAINRRVRDAADVRRVFVNVVDDAELSGFQMPAVVQRGSLQVAISSGGAAPMLARQLREMLEIQLDPSLGALADLLTRQRQRIRDRFPNLALRRRWFSKLLTGPVAQLLRQQKTHDAEHALLASMAPTSDKPRGSVVLVGAGPGDPGLLTIKALRALNEADVIVYDRLVSAEVLALARRDAEFIEVGKQANGPSTTQEKIHVVLLEQARAGRRVVRLKGGDPFVFGRGGEELEVLRAHGIDFEVVPGITAALACAAYAGIPLTHREYAQSLQIMTAHGKEDDSIDWQVLANGRQTLAIYMGVSALSIVRDRLLAHGRSGDTPFALIENGSRPEQRVITGQLSNLPELAELHRVMSPALLIVGEVAGFANTLHWFGQAPLSNSDQINLRNAA